MRKRIRIFVLGLIVLAATACKKPVSSEMLRTYSESETETVSSENNGSPETEAPGDVPVSPAADGIDVDLTELSPTMVYSEVYQMMLTPENYIGKTIKMDGLFSYYRDESTGKEYFSCIIQDATACCAQGIEFILSGEHSYPEDYPKDGENVCVVGVFDTYTEGDSMYCTLRNAEYAK